MTPCVVVQPASRAGLVAMFHALRRLVRLVPPSYFASTPIRQIELVMTL